MTVAAITRKAGPYRYTAGASYPFYYKVFSAEDVAVYVVQDSSELQLTEDQYTVNLNDDQDNNPGGTVSVSVTCESITIVSDVDYTQETVITNRGGFYPDVLNKIHDKLTILIQQILTTLNRTVKIKVTDATSDPDKILDDLETTASAAAESAAISVSAAQASADSAATAIATANTALSKSETALSQSTEALSQSSTALSQSTEALSQSTEAVNSIQPALAAAQQASIDAAEALEKSNQALTETTAIDDKVNQAVVDAISGVTIPGLSTETIVGTLGYTPYDADTNSKNFATTSQVSDAIAGIPEQVNADWNASTGAAQILNKPTLSAVATSGQYSDLADKPTLSAVATSGNYDDLIGGPTVMTGATTETAGKQGLVPAPQAGDEDKVLTGSGEWKNASVNPGLIDITELANEVAAKPDKTQVANLAMPSDKSISISIPSSGSSVVAPADGYFVFTALAGNQNGYIYLLRTNGIGSRIPLIAGFSGKALLPVKEGDDVTVGYLNLNTSTLLFIYAEGTQP